MSTARWWWCTAKAPGAIAVACVNGPAEALDRAMNGISGAGAPAVGHIAWRKFGDHFDDGVIARVAPETILLMPHGGARIAARVDEALAAVGCEPATCDLDAPGARATYPEAADEIEALMLAELSRAASPRAVDLLMAQPERWRAARREDSSASVGRPTERDTQLNRLITPARVLVVGPANAGKSTLLNALAGRAVAVVHDMPGTTRDAVAARIDLDGVVVDWFDTPGVRAHPDATEVHASAIAAELEAHADLVVQLTAPGLGWLQRPRALRVLNKSDTPNAAQCAERAGADLSISAQRGDNLAALVARVREMLVPEAALTSTEPWWFSPALASATLESR